MAAGLEETLISVWQQALVDDAKIVTLEGRNFPVRRTSRSRLREVDFQFEGHELRGLEQNPETASRWAQLARKGKKVMQFLEQRRYIAVVVDAKVLAAAAIDPKASRIFRASSDNSSSRSREYGLRATSVAFIASISPGRQAISLRVLSRFSTEPDMS